MDFGTTTIDVTFSELAGVVLGERGTECLGKGYFARIQSSRIRTSSASRNCTQQR